MQALILAGGKGTRLRPLTLYTPKPIVPVMNRPFLIYQLDILRRAGITDIVLSLSYQPDKIEQLLGDGSEYGVSLRYVTEPSPLGTGGAYRFASDVITDTTVVLNGDILTDLDLSAVVNAHVSTEAEATIVLTPVTDPSSYGLVELDDERRVRRFLEKPKPEQIADLQTDTINAGIYVLEPGIRDLIPQGENRSFEYHVFPELLERKSRFYGYVIAGEYWRDLGTPSSYHAAHIDFLAGRIRGFEREAGGDSDVAHTASIDADSLLAEGCIVKPNARITNSVLGPGVHVEERAIIQNSVIWGHTRVAASAEVRGAVIARSCHIGRSSFVGEGSVLGDKASIPDYSRV
ncbi:MAG: sugar phosphate nucleotidyltransferase [Pyrinomonadaceae bacterium]